MSPVPTHNHDLNLFPGTEEKATEARRRAAARPARLARLGATALVLLMLVGALCASPSSASFGGLLGGGRQPDGVAPAASEVARESRPAASEAAKKEARAALFAPGLFAPFRVAGETVATYAADCATEKASFALGETVCAKVTGAPVSPTFTLRFVQLINTEGHIVASFPVTAASQDTLFTLPTQAVVGLGGRNFDNRGRWRVNLTDTDDATVRSFAPIIVHDPDPQIKVSDLQITRSIVGSTAPVAGQNISFEIHVYNMGPDAAENVRFSDSTLANTTFVQVTQTRGPLFNCTTPALGESGTTTCTRASLAEGEGANFILVYKLGSGILDSSDLTGTTSVTSDTTERRGDDNDSSSETNVKNPTPPACTVSCPDNVTVANGTGLGGAFVSFAAPTASSGCGTSPVSVIPASGSFFAIGSSVVNAELPGGQTCSFIVTVSDEEDPAISCPPDISVFEGASTPGSANVSFNVPATDNSGEVNVSCNHQSGGSFNVGTTPITCTASDAAGNTSECTFNVTVESRTAGCTLTQPSDVVVDSPANACGANVNFDTPAPADGATCGTVTCDRAPGSFFPVGTTPVTCTSRPDGASTTFNVTVVDRTAPVPDVATLPTVTRDCVVTLTTIPTATDKCGGQIGGSTSDPRTYEDPGTYTVHWTFTDDAGNTTTQPQTVVVTGTDTTPPTVTAPPAVTLQTGAGSTSCSVTVADVDALLGEADAVDTCSGASIVRTGVPAGGVFPVGVTTITYTATDGSGNTAHATQTVTVVDNTLPTISLNGSPAVTVECHTPFTDPGATAADNCAVQVVTTGAVDANTPGTYTVTYRAKDASGNLSTATVSRTVTVVDTTAPAISCPANVVVYLPLNSTATSMPVSYPAPTALDSCGDAEVATSHPSGSVFPVGPTTVTATATDDYNNSSSCTFTVTVLYNFTGFFQPVGNIPVLNQVKAGQAVPLKFSLSGNKGLGIFPAGSPASAQVACGSDAAVDLEDTVTAGSSSLSYNPTSDQYSYVWKTEGGWAGTCRQLVVTLDDGTTHRANFKFK